VKETARARRKAGGKEEAENECQKGDKESGEVGRIGRRRAPERWSRKFKETAVSRTARRAYDEGQTMHAPPTGCRLHLEPNGKRKQNKRNEDSTQAYLLGDRRRGVGRGERMRRQQPSVATADLTDTGMVHLHGAAANHVTGYTIRGCRCSSQRAHPAVLHGPGRARAEPSEQPQSACVRDDRYRGECGEELLPRSTPPR
jgi:hypothetical protein